MHDTTKTHWGLYYCVYIISVHFHKVKGVARRCFIGCEMGVGRELNWKPHTGFHGDSAAPGCTGGCWSGAASSATATSWRPAVGSPWQLSNRPQPPKLMYSDIGKLMNSDIGKEFHWKTLVTRDKRNAIVNIHKHLVWWNDLPLWRFYLFSYSNLFSNFNVISNDINAHSSLSISIFHGVRVASESVCLDWTHLHSPGRPAGSWVGHTLYQRWGRHGPCTSAWDQYLLK